MNRGDVVKLIAEAEDLPVSTVDQILGRFFDVVGTGLTAGEDISIRRFGKFEQRKRRAVVRRNPKTGIEIHVPAKLSVGFIPSNSLKDRLNQNGRRNGRRVRS